MLIFTLVTVLIAIGLLVSTLFLISVLIHRNDIADVAWGIGILLSGVMAIGITGEKGPVISLVLALVFIWSLRLSGRIALRNLKKAEDYRYKAWRESWGKWFYLRSYFQIYLLQGFLMVVVASPVIHASVFGGNVDLGMFSYLGALVWLIGFYFEVVGDYELDQFIKNPDNKGKIMTSGLWQFSRHPNYFGEITMWWGIWLIISPLPYSALALIGPLTISFLIIKVSGIPLLEAKFAGQPDWEAYKAKTSPLLPLPPNCKIGQILIRKLNW
jgi:steroid 5-alpha reductase family enzyme